MRRGARGETRDESGVWRETETGRAAAGVPGRDGRGSLGAGVLLCREVRGARGRDSSRDGVLCAFGRFSRNDDN